METYNPTNQGKLCNHLAQLLKKEREKLLQGVVTTKQVLNKYSEL